MVEVNTIDANVLNQPVHAFNVIVMPAAHTAVYNSSILYSGYKPGRDIIVANMLLQPAESTTLAGRINFMSETAERECFVGFIGKLTDCIVNFHFQPFGMRLVNKPFHLFVFDERI